MTRRCYSGKISVTKPGPVPDPKRKVMLDGLTSGGGNTSDRDVEPDGTDPWWMADD